MAAPSVYVVRQASAVDRPWGPGCPRDAAFFAVPLTAMDITWAGSKRHIPNPAGTMAPTTKTEMILKMSTAGVPPPIELSHSRRHYAQQPTAVARSQFMGNAPGSATPANEMPPGRRQFPGSTAQARSQSPSREGFAYHEVGLQRGRELVGRRSSSADGSRSPERRSEAGVSGVSFGNAVVRRRTSRSPGRKVEDATAPRVRVRSPAAEQRGDASPGSPRRMLSRAKSAASLKEVDVPKLVSTPSRKHLRHQDSDDTSTVAPASPANSLGSPALTPSASSVAMRMSSTSVFLNKSASMPMVVVGDPEEALSKSLAAIKALQAAEKRTRQRCPDTMVTGLAKREEARKKIHEKQCMHVETAWAAACQKLGITAPIVA